MNAGLDALAAERATVERFIAEQDNAVCECGGFLSEHETHGGCRHCQCPEFIEAQPFEDREARAAA